MRNRTRRNMSRFFIVLSAASCWFILIASSVLGEQTAVTATGVLEEVFLPEGANVRVEVWIDNLDIPWSLIFLPDGRALVSERPGRIRLIKNGKLEKEPYAEPEVFHSGEGGLMGLALHPQFPKEPYVYFMHTYRENGKVYNRIVRLHDLGNRGEIDRVIIDQIPGGKNHNGGRIAFGPDGMLYIATGETFKAQLAQDLGSLAGKILRLTPEGEIPEDNPFPGSAIYSYGHRNPQGLAWHPTTQDLFISEHGPSGEFFKFANDEVNVIRKGSNYGWPDVIGRAEKESYTDPLIVWKKTTPPSGITFYGGDLFVATLRSNAIVKIELNIKENGDYSYEVKRVERWFAEGFSKGEFGRIRDVVVGTDGYLYFLTNNRDGRGTPRADDDKIYRIVPEELE